MKAVLIICAIIGISYSAPKPRSLSDDLQDFIDLIPLEDIKDILDYYLQNDGTFTAVILYFQEEEWHLLIDQIGDKPEVQEFIQYLTDAGLPIQDLLDFIQNTIENAVPGVEGTGSGSLRSFLDAMEAFLPVDDLISLLNDKLQSSPDFQQLYQNVSSDHSYDLVEEIRSYPEVQRLVRHLRDFGVRIDEVLAVIYDFLGWGVPKHA